MSCVYVNGNVFGVVYYLENPFIILIHVDNFFINSKFLDNLDQLIIEQKRIMVKLRTCLISFPNSHKNFDGFAMENKNFLLINSVDRHLYITIPNRGRIVLLLDWRKGKTSLQSQFNSCASFLINFNKL